MRFRFERLDASGPAVECLRSAAGIARRIEREHPAPAGQPGRGPRSRNPLRSRDRLRSRLRLRGPAPGTTLLELAVVLALLALLLGAAAPALGGALDGYAVRVARDGLAAELARARMAAVSHGGAELVVDPAAARAWIVTRVGDTIRGAVLGEGLDIQVTPDGAAGGAVAIRFDGLGVGRLASRTIRFRRGRAEAGLTISAYGRVRAW